MTAPVKPPMAYAEYLQLHTALVAAALASIRLILAPFRLFTLPLTGWLHILALIYPIVENYRKQSGELARQFYDSERRDKTGIPDPNPSYLAEYDPDWFQHNMEPVRKAFSEEDATEGSEAKVLSQVAREIESGGRQTMLRAINEDEEVLGWARVQGGEDSCAFCAMLISRGPVYESAESAGLMDEWHPNCDCKVVPVFDRDNWPGRDQYLAALDLWKQATANGEKGKDALNSLRRLINKRQDDEGQPLPQAA